MIVQCLMLLIRRIMEDKATVNKNLSATDDIVVVEEEAKETDLKSEANHSEEEKIVIRKRKPPRFKKKEDIQKFPKIIVEFNGTKYPRISFENHETLRARDLRNLPTFTYRELQKLRARIVHVSQKG